MTVVYLTEDQVLELHRRAIELFGGTPGIRDRGGVASAVAQPQATYGGQDLHETIADKAATLGFMIVAAQHFADGNKRTGHAAMETFLLLNGYELMPSYEAQQHIIEGVAAGSMPREQFTEWVAASIEPRDPI